MPQLVRMYMIHVVIGFVLSAGFVTLLLTLNVANLWHLVSHSSAGVLAVFLLWLFNGIVFSGVQFGIAIMRMASHDGDAGRGKRIQFATPTVPSKNVVTITSGERKG